MVTSSRDDLSTQVVDQRLSMDATTTRRYTHGEQLAARETTLDRATAHAEESSDFGDRVPVATVTLKLFEHCDEARVRRTAASHDSRSSSRGGDDDGATLSEGPDGKIFRKYREIRASGTACKTRACRVLSCRVASCQLSSSRGRRYNIARRMSDPDTRRYLTRREAAAYARLSTRTIDRAVREGHLRVAGTQRRRLFLKQWIDEWLIDEEQESACA